MYPTGELKDLARRKALLRQSIARRRSDCAAALAEVAQPLAWLDRAHALWHRLTPFLQLFAAVFGPSAARTFAPRRKFFHRVVRWAPSLFRLFSVFRRARAATTTAATDA